MSKGFVIHEAGHTSECDLVYESIRAAIGNWIEHVPVNDVASFFADEEGMLNGRRLNHVASFVCGRPIYGTVVVIAADPDEEGNSLPVEEDFVRFCQHVSDRWVSVRNYADRLNQNIDVIADADVLPPPTIVQLPEDWCFGDPIPTPEEP